MASSTFVLKEPTSKTKSLIYLIIRDKGKRLKYSTQETILPKNWNSKTQEARTLVSFNGDSINTQIKLLQTGVTTFISEYKVLNKSTPSLKEIKKHLDSTYRKDNNIVDETNLNFIQYFEKYLVETSKRINRKTNKLISRSTLKTLKNSFTLLKEYNKLNKNTENFESINLEWYYKFVDYLNTTKKYGTNTSGKHISNIKTVLRSATERGFNKNLAYMSKEFLASRDDTDAIYLNEKELNEIYKLDLSNDTRLEKVRDLFIVGCYTGLRYSDVSKIRDMNIQEEFITLTTRKTKGKVKLPYHPFVREILEKYKGITNNSLPPSVSNSKMNLYIKEVCERIKILNKDVEVTKSKGGLEVISKQKKYTLVSTHTMRRSFATNLYDAKVKVSDIMEVTGHKTETMFFKYIKRDKGEGARNIQLFWNQKSMKVS